MANAEKIYLAAQDAEALKKLYFPLSISEDMQKEVEEFAGKVFEVKHG